MSAYWTFNPAADNKRQTFVRSKQTWGIMKRFNELNNSMQTYLHDT